VKQNVTFAGTNALARYTSSVGYADTCLAAARAGAVLGLPRKPIHCRAPASQPSRGSQSKGHAARLTEQTSFARIQKLSPLCTTSLLFVSPVLPVPRGVSGGGAALSPGFSLHLCSLSKHGAHFAAEPPERAFLRRFRVSGFCLRSFARAKNGVNLR